MPARWCACRKRSCGAAEINEPRLATGPEDSGDLCDRPGDRVEVAKDVGGEHGIEGPVSERQRFPYTNHPVGTCVEREHLGGGIERHDPAVAEVGIGRTGAAAEIEDPAARETADCSASPRRIAAE